MEHLSNHELLSNKQFGFRPGASTQEAILSATRVWHEALERGNSIASVFFDLSKAFDSLPHHLILQSLAMVGVCGSLLAWIKDYPTNRLQRVVLYGSTSSTSNVTSGVPQGSILGPLLFIVTMDSITNIKFSARAALTLYADDMLLQGGVY